MSNNELNNLTPKEKKAIYAKEWKRKNKDKVLAEKSRYRKKHRENLRNKQIAYHKTVDGKISKAINSRGKEKRACSLSLTVEYAKELLKGQRGRCNNCGCRISHEAKNINLDHFIPITKGGLNTLDNVQWLCKNCNMTKFNWLPPFPLTFILWETV